MTLLLFTLRLIFYNQEVRMKRFMIRFLGMHGVRHLESLRRLEEYMHVNGIGV